MTRILTTAVLLSLFSGITMNAAAENLPFPFPDVFGDGGDWTPLPLPLDTKELAETALKAKAEALANPEIAVQFAKFVRNYYDALLNEGFTEQEVLQILTATGIPSLQ